MPEYEIIFARSARKELESLDSGIVNRLFPKIEALAKKPHPPGSLKIQGHENLWRIRVGDYRVIYSVDDIEKIVDITSIRHRRDVYRFIP